ncbi:glycoside hydrolase family 2 TIM barrel-domain containing protein [Colwellia sp. 12G3]|uniref:glycoside hydrolase family 2 TIM barrel-domain containing protein n=1 Tax=Colwellia sp. 12G3 TaxID=2058299 RepID=UPI000C32D584|nr:glycoside hydrolase family 2 TIM barrel-domain containing protein [Colwellia sp. 12G3]PKI16669.1 glycoside hydrolase family 2 [Colwellia sp. 12G3]
MKVNSLVSLTSIFFLAIVISLFINVNASALTQSQSVANDKQSFNDDWRFAKGELSGAEQANFNDDKWRSLRLPHDWAIEGPFSKKYSARNGGLPVFGTAWYRKSFTLAKHSQGKLVSVTFDGVMANSQVYVNGKLVGERPFGYIGFHYEISQYLKPAGEKNIIAVKVAPENYAARWYSGSGIYRNTWIEFNDPAHIKQWSTQVSTPVIASTSAQVAVSTVIANNDVKNDLSVEFSIIDASGKVVASKQKKITASSIDDLTISELLTVSKPRRWDINDPYRYQVITTLLHKGKVIDSDKQPLGIRTIEFKAKDGFWLNGRRVEIQGVCLHHDNGPLGAVANTRAIERKLEIMQSMGVNAVRTSHNPPSPELVELADKMGILLQVEAFDTWKKAKATVVNGYHKHYDKWSERDLTDMVKIHRNNPSIIMWSIGNEIYEQKKKDGWKYSKRLTKIVKQADPTRLVTVGLSDYPNFVHSKIAEEVDIVGLNYKATEYADIIKIFPNKPILGSETSSVVSTRGEYHFPVKPLEKHPSKYISSYDMYAPYWAYIPDIEWDELDKNPAVMGEFIWTGFDYLGEPTPYGGRDHGDQFYWNADWPARSSSFGAVDLAGFPKDRFYLYQSRWTTKPMVHVLPHWNWPNRVGETIPVVAYTNAEEVELFVNGVSQGRKVKGVDKMRIPVELRYKKDIKHFDSPYRLSWDVEYQAGNIKVIAYNQGKAVAEKQIFTAGLPAQVKLTADRTVLSADGYDLAYITVDVLDSKGNFVPYADNLIHFTVKGAGKIAAVGNGDSATIEPFVADYRRAFNGKALLIVRTIKGQTGAIEVSAYSKELNIKAIKLTSK